MEVHKVLGCGFLEKVYQEALAIEFTRRNIPFRREVRLPIYYKGELLNQEYYADFICYNKVILELKAVAQLNTAHQSQLINYLHCTDLRVGLLLNFGDSSLIHQRIIV